MNKNSIRKFEILIIVVISTILSMQCAFATNHNGSANATKYICSSGILPVTWNGYVDAESQLGRDSTYSNSQYSRLHVNSAGIYVSKTAKWSSGSNKGKSKASIFRISSTYPYLLKVLRL